ncbi:hypothetical protein BV501_09485 [Erwinia sp. OAMSP11]|nr:hypothetical protein BV501_09485 [Erwinia sp. OAMSP11]
MLSGFGLANAASHTSNLSVVFDAGSSKTRAYLYQLSGDEVKQIAVSDSGKPLSAFGKTPDSAGKEAIGPLLKQLSSKITGEHKNVTVNVLGTAGMRQLTEAQQNAIYANIRQEITQAGYSVGRTETIAGWEEGAYAWAHLNQLTGKAGTDNTQGIIEVGGASAQITFDAKDANLAGVHKVDMKGKTYYLWSESLLGFGANSVRDSMNKESEKNSCYPAGFESSTGFKFSACDNAYDKAIASDPDAKALLEKTAAIPALKQTHFVGLSALNYTLEFFDNKTPQKDSLKQSLETSCKSYQEIQDSLARNPAKDRYDPQFKCANGTFAYNLLYDYLKLNDGSIEAVKKVNNVDIRWTSGFLLLDTHAAKK